MKKKMQVHTVIREINRKLAAKGHILKARPSRVKLKRYSILDLSGNVVDADIDLEALARRLGVLKEGGITGTQKKQGPKS